MVYLAITCWIFPWQTGNVITRWYLYRTWRIPWYPHSFNGHFRNKLEVPTIYKAYVREYPHKIWPYMVQYLHFRILKFPLTLRCLKRPGFARLTSWTPDSLRQQLRVHRMHWATWRARASRRPIGDRLSRWVVPVMGFDGVKLKHMGFIKLWLMEFDGCFFQNCRWNMMECDVVDI